MRRHAAAHPPDSDQAHWYLVKAEIAELYTIYELESEET